MNLAQRRVQIHRPRRPISTLAGHTLSPRALRLQQEKRPPVGVAERSKRPPPDSYAELDLVGGIEVGFLWWDCGGFLVFDRAMRLLVRWCSRLCSWFGWLVLFVANFLGVASGFGLSFLLPLE